MLLVIITSDCCDWVESQANSSHSSRCCACKSCPDAAAQGCPLLRTLSHGRTALGRSRALGDGRLWVMSPSPPQHAREEKRADEVSMASILGGLSMIHVIYPSHSGALNVLFNPLAAGPVCQFVRLTPASFPPSLSYSKHPSYHIWQACLSLALSGWAPLSIIPRCGHDAGVIDQKTPWLERYSVINVS